MAKAKKPKRGKPEETVLKKELQRLVKQVKGNQPIDVNVLSPDLCSFLVGFPRKIVYVKHAMDESTGKWVFVVTRFERRSSVRETVDLICAS